MAMKKILLFWCCIICGLVIAVIGGSTAYAQCVYKPRSVGLTETPDIKDLVILHHGINLSQWWEDRQDRAVTSSELQNIRDLGFDFVRLPVSPAWLDIADAAEHNKKMDALRCDLIAILNADLRIVVDMHPSVDTADHLRQNTADLVPFVESHWQKMRTVIHGLPPSRVILQLWNEPLVETGVWWRIQERIIKDLRTDFQDHTFIVSAGPFNGWWSLIEKTPYADPKLIYDFHFYDPMVFTHHGAEWLEPKHVATADSPITYPVDTKFNFGDDFATQDYVAHGWGKHSIDEIVQHIGAWKNKYHTDVLCSEFGVYRAHVDDISRYAWLQDTTNALQKARIPWSLWEYRGPFGIVDAHGELDKSMLDVLHLGYQVKE
jgi:endoglucanase